MLIDTMIAAINARAQGRFVVTSDRGDLLPSIIDTSKTGVCRLRRVGSSSGWRTILIATLDFTSEAVQTAVHWAASVRDQLPEPETADLYMFLMIDGIPSEEAARIETDDRFCRKVVLRADEQANDLLDRTFLAALTPDGQSGTIGDPLQTALTSLATKHPWTGTHLLAWQEILLSGKTGSELAQALDSVQSTGDAAL
ncbi:ABC-three component system middle component 1 [Pseudomonas helleri]|uniref:ABC-three component system middle component 1 n=1 Tax=Pseudomonas helleri TaxID=1608996 RepID=UPI003FD5B218